MVASLLSSGRCEWEDPQAKTTLRIFYKTPTEWASIISSRLAKLAYYSGQLLTVYELHSGTPASGTEFEGLDADTVLRALRILEQQGKLDVIPGDSLDETAVRIK